MFGRNNDNDVQTQIPQDPPQLVPQRKFRVRWYDSGEVIEEIVACRLIRLAGDGTISFMDAIQTPAGYAEFIVLVVAIQQLVSYREVFELAGSGLVN